MAMPESAPRSITVGDGRCFSCGHPVQVKASKNGYLCYVCLEDGGGCGSQHFARGETSNAAMAARVTKWRKPEYRGHYVTAEDVPEPDDEVPADEPPAPPPPSPRPATAPKPKPAPARKPGAAARCGTCGTIGEKGKACNGCGEKV